MPLLYTLYHFRYPAHSPVTPQEGLRLWVAVHTTCPLQQSLGSVHPNLLFEGHFQPFSLSTSFHHPGVGIPPAEQVDSGICVHREPVEAHQSLAHTLRLLSGLDGNSISGWEGVSCQVRFLYYCFPEDQQFRGGSLIKKNAK